MSSSRNSNQTTTASTSSVALPLALSDYRFLSVLGQGAYGIIWFAHDMRNNSACAVKAIKRQTRMYSGSDGFTDFEREVECMERVDPKFPFIVQIVGHFKTPCYDFLVMEYAGCGDLHLLKPNGPMPESRVRLYIAELGCALQHLHDRKIIHRDIKLKNVVIGADGHLKLIDFGSSKVMTTKTTGSVVGTLSTMAPEVLANKQYDFRADWYSLGVVFYQMVVGKIPFCNELEDKYAFKEKVINGTMHFPRNLTPDCLSLLKRLLERDPQHRLAGFQDLLHHEWFQGFSPESVLLKHHMPRYLPGSHLTLELSGFGPHYEHRGAKEFRGPSKSHIPAFLHDGRPKRKSPPATTTHDKRPRKRTPPLTTTPPDSQR